MTGADQTRKTVSDRIVALLRRLAAPYDAPITDNTEVYYDLGLAGDDLHELVAELRDQFGTDISRFHLQCYAPGEVGHTFGLNLVRAYREWSGKRTYRSLTVGRLADAVQKGRWEDA